MRRIFSQAVPEQALDAGARAQVDEAQREERRGLLLELEGVVIGLLHVLARHRAPHLGEVLQDLGVLLRDRIGLLAREHLVDAEHVEDQHRVVRHHRAPGLGHDVGVRHAGLVAGLLDVRHHVVRVLLGRVVLRAVEVRLGAVVVDAEPAADVEQCRPGAHLVQAHEDPAGLLDGVLERADRGDLRADVEVQQLEAVEHVLGAQALHGVHDLERREPELRAIARSIPPTCRRPWW